LLANWHNALGTQLDLKQKLNDDLKQSLRDRDATRTSTLRLLLSAVRYAELKKQQTEFDKEVAEAGAEKDEEALGKLNLSGVKEVTLSEEEIQAVIAKEIKQRQDSIDAFKKGGRQDLVDKETAELAVLKSYGPRLMSREEIMTEAKRVINEVGARSSADKSRVMPRLIAELKGKADGREINSVVTELLDAL
jgi:uncharacterized protein YqeY